MTAYKGRRVREFQGFAGQAARRFTILDSADELQDLSALRSNRLEVLTGGRAGQHSIRIIQQRHTHPRLAVDVGQALLALT